MRTTFLTLLFLVVSTQLRADELERFWHDFPGFEHTLPSYGYDRSFSARAKPEFVDAVIEDTAHKPSKQRLAEYLCVLYYMDAKTVTDHMGALESSSSPATRKAAATIRKRLKEYGGIPPKTR